MLSYEISKFLFYNFNGFLKINNLPILPIQLFRSTKVLGNDYTLKILQETNQPYFIERILEVSEKQSLQLKNLGTTIDIKENKIIFFI